MESHEAIDVSHYQGNINFAQVNRDIVIMKASQGTTFLDPNLFTYYDQAKHKNGKLVGLYHFANGEDPVAEASWFLRCAAPIEQYDVFVLDFEISIPNPVAWCQAFCQHVHDVIGVWPLIYMNRSTLAGFNWNPVLANSGLWIADPDHNPDSGAQTYGHTYVMHQYGSGSVPGVPTACDLDRWWGSEESFKKYGYNYAPPTPTPPPQPVITVSNVVETVAIAPQLTSVDDASMDEGTTKITQQGVPGVETKTYTVTYSDGTEVNRVLASDVVTTPPVDQITHVGTKVPDTKPPSLWDELMGILQKVINFLKGTKA